VPSELSDSTDRDPGLDDQPEGEATTFGLEGLAGDPEMARNPQPGYTMLRESMPVMRIPGQMTIISRHDDVMFALKNPELFSSINAIEIGNVRPLIPLQIDPPDHVKYRRLLDPIFAPREMAKLEPKVRALVSDLIDGFIERGACEFSADLAIPLPCRVFLELLGLPYAHLDRFLQWKDDIIRPTGPTPAGAKAVQAAAGQAIYDYFAPVIADRRANPQDDLITLFVQAEIDGHGLDDDEVADICYLFLIAGLDTVTATLTCSISYLAQHPDRRDEIVNDPALVSGAVEELMRWECPVPGLPRQATQDIELRGETIKQGENVICLLGSANIDPAEFPDPEVIDFSRSGNRHLAFGGGVHRCLGSHLARLELRVAMEEIHRRLPDYSIAPGETPTYTAGLRAVDYLPLVFTPGPSLGGAGS
jgi:cytochrome P450